MTGTGGVRVLIDGKEIYTNDSELSFKDIPNLDSFVLGGNRDDGNKEPNQWAFSGMLKNFRVYNQRLSDKQLSKL